MGILGWLRTILDIVQAKALAAALAGAIVVAARAMIAEIAAGPSGYKFRF